MKMFLAFVIFLFCFSARAYDISSQDTIDPVFVPYVAEFIMESKGMISWKDFEHVEIHFRDLSKHDVGDPNKHAIGLCTWGTQLFGKHNTLEFDPLWWQYAPEAQHWATFEHEAGHCILNRQHTDTEPPNLFLLWLQSIRVKIDMHVKNPYLRDGCPASLMHPDEFDTDCIYRHRAHYIEELFSKAHPTPLDFYVDEDDQENGGDLSVKDPIGRFFFDRQH